MSTSHKLHFVDLFAGCGGLSLGLENAGFHPVYVNELNQDAMSTYRVNRLSSEAGRHLLDKGFFSHDIKKELVLKRGELTALSKRIASAFGVDPRAGELDLVVGGPPCQGFSGIGHRRSYSVNKEQLPSNHLYEDMLFVVSKLQPRLFLFENVKGLLSARWTAGGEKGEIWRDIQAEFREELKNYQIEPELVYAKEYGVPQNRPRVLMVGIRRDVAARAALDPNGRAKGHLPEPTGGAPNLIDVLGDLVDPGYEPGMKATEVYPCESSGDYWPDYYRRDPITGEVRGKDKPVSDHEYSKHDKDIVKKFRHMIDHGGEIPEQYKTKKFAQRVLPKTWGDAGPTITATSLPDDYVHFQDPRTLTVREWARLQTFPDWYEFKGKRTTGGLRRAGNPRENLHDRELPKYTQIGNAVPVLLAEAVGKHFARILADAASSRELAAQQDLVEAIA
jgi:DNA (cytosine-5)-methyltransferase 1